MSDIRPKNRASLWATALLGAVSGLAAASRLPIWQRMFGTPLWLEMVRAGSQAGVVGGLADWFAVTALFRQPLGLPIPHTAILPRRKEQLGQALGRFMAEHFLSEEEVTRFLERIEFPVVIARLLQKPATEKRILDQLGALVPELVEGLGDGRGGSFIAQLFPVLVRREDVALLVVRGLKAMVDEDIHQEVFSFFLAQFKQLVITREVELHQFVQERVREQGGRLIGWAIGASVATQVLTALKAELGRVDPMDSDLRHGFTKWVRKKIYQLDKDPQSAQELMERIAVFFSHDSVRVWSSGLWQRLCLMVKEDSYREDGLSQQALSTMYQQVVKGLGSRTEFAYQMDQTIRQAIKQSLPSIQQAAENMIARVIKGWDAESLSAKLEAGIGRDLAYIRVNGTVVGFVVGAVLEVLLGWFVP